MPLVTKSKYILVFCPREISNSGFKFRLWIFPVAISTFFFFKVECKFCPREKSCYVSGVSKFCHSQCWIRTRRARVHKVIGAKHVHTTTASYLRKIERFGSTTNRIGWHRIFGYNIELQSHKKLSIFLFSAAAGKESGWRCDVD
jgi:hypothetical protein